MIVWQNNIKQDKTLNFALDLNGSSGLALKHEIMRSITTKYKEFTLGKIKPKHKNQTTHNKKSTNRQIL
jgi:hypothetical protein